MHSHKIASYLPSFRFGKIILYLYTYIRLCMRYEYLITFGHDFDRNLLNNYIFPIVFQHDIMQYFLNKI